MYMGTSCHENSWCVSQSLKYNSAIYLDVLSLFCRRVNVTGTNKQSSLLLFLSNEYAAFLTDLVFIQIPLHSCHIHSKPLTSNHINKTVSLPFFKIRNCWRIQCLLLSSTSVSTAQGGQLSFWPTSSTTGPLRIVHLACHPATGAMFTTPLPKSCSSSPNSSVYVILLSGFFIKCVASHEAGFQPTHALEGSVTSPVKWEII